MNPNDIKTLIETGKIIFLDEAYIEFSGKSLIRWIEKYPNLIIGRTFSKIYGLAGLRIGFAFIHKSLAKYYLNSITPFVLSGAAQAASTSAIDDHSFVKRSIRLVKEGKKFYYKELKKLNVNFLPTDANFITINTYPQKAKKIAYELLKKGIIVRDCSSFGYGAEYFLRISIGKREQNRRVVEELKKIF